MEIIFPTDANTDTVGAIGLPGEGRGIAREFQLRISGQIKNRAKSQLMKCHFETSF
jgi:hypothetical protein